MKDFLIGFGIGASLALGAYSAYLSITDQALTQWPLVRNGIAVGTRG